MHSESLRHCAASDTRCASQLPARQTARKFDSGSLCAHFTFLLQGAATQSITAHRDWDRRSAAALIACGLGGQQRISQQPSKLVITHSRSERQPSGLTEGTSAAAEPATRATASARERTTLTLRD